MQGDNAHEELSARPAITLNKMSDLCCIATDSRSRARSGMMTNIPCRVYGPSMSITDDRYPSSSLFIKKNIEWERKGEGGKMREKER